MQHAFSFSRINRQSDRINGFSGLGVFDEEILYFWSLASKKLKFQSVVVSRVIQVIRRKRIGIWNSMTKANRYT